MKLRPALNLLALFATVAVNGLANGLPINGVTTGEVSDSFPVLFTPAGYVFAIWGLIYLLLTGFAIYQVLPAQQNNPRLERIGYWFVASSFFNSIWIFLWHYGQFLLTMVAMLGLLISLVVIYLRLGIGSHRQSSWTEKLLVDLPFSVYLGWISVATVANASVMLYDLGWNGGPIGPQFWTVAVLLVAAGLGIAMILRRGEVAYPLVLAWAFVGITVNQGETPLVAWTALLAAGALLILLVFNRLRGGASGRAPAV